MGSIILRLEFPEKVKTLLRNVHENFLRFLVLHAPFVKTHCDKKDEDFTPLRQDYSFLEKAKNYVINYTSKLKEISCLNGIRIQNDQ